jgi:hypothetical protein
MTYALNDKVNTPKGVGIISYIDEAYIEVDVSGVDMGFESPFDLLSPYLSSTKTLDDYDTPDCSTFLPSTPTPEWDAALQEVPRILLALAISTQNTASGYVNQLGGSATGWGGLNSFQKLNFVLMAGGQGPAYYKDISEQKQKASA